ncbi:hypothetical protein [Halosimplex marinum]|uniref:hypothetical protein n=1 Tax=Halosimplex marinum TaxID=3396620 RepID=UPI003F5705AF
MTDDESRGPNRRWVLKALGASVAASAIAGCSGDSDEGDGGSDGSGGGDGGSGGQDGGDGGSGGSDGGDDSDGDAGGDGSSGGGGASGGGTDGADSPKAAVERYVQASQDDDGEAMSAIVHPDGTATTSPESGGGSTGEVTVNSMTVTAESDTEATVEVSFDLTVSQDGEEQTSSAVTTFEARTYEGEWFVYSVSEPTFEDGGDTGGTPSGGGESTPSGNGESTPTDGGGSEEFVRESMGSVGRDDIDELTIVAWQSEATDSQFNVQIAVRNDGDQRADAREYTYQITAYDDSGAELESMGTAVAYPMETAMAPGEVASVVATPDVSADPETVASYEISFHCDGPFAEGVYCSG